MKRTERGFAIYTEFKEERGVGLRVLASSIATRRRVWIYLDATKSTYDLARLEPHHIGAHLSPAEARRVAKALLAFAGGRE